MLLCTPTIPEEPNWNKQRGVNHWGKAEFWLCHTVILLRELHEKFVTQDPKRNHTQDTADSHSDECEASSARRETVFILEDEREGRKEKVDDAVNDGRVQGEEENNRRHEEHFQGSYDGELKDNGRRIVALILGPVGLIPGFFAEVGSFNLKKSRSISFFEDESAQDCN